MKRTIKIPLLLTILLFVGCGSGDTEGDGEQISNAVDNQTNAIIEQTQVLEEF